jgi:hypothetical protein
MLCLAPPVYGNDGNPGCPNGSWHPMEKVTQDNGERPAEPPADVPDVSNG